MLASELLPLLAPPLVGAMTALGTIHVVAWRRTVARARAIQLVRAKPPMLARVEPRRNEATTAPPTIRRYAMSSLFLQRCLERLTRDDTEHVIAVSGVQHGNLFVPCIVCPVQYERVSPVEVVADFTSSHRQLVGLSRYGHLLLGIFHSHPGFGPGAVRESSIDRATQKAFEEAGYPLIGGVFSRDGFVSFFSVATKFEIQAYGRGLTEVSPHVFRIAQRARHLPVRTPHAGPRWRRDGR